MIRNTTLTLLGAVFLSVSAARAQTLPVRSNLALMANDHYTRSHDYDLIHQRIVLSHFNWDSTSFEGSVTTTLVSRRAGLDAIVLDEGRLLRNTRITDRAGHPLQSSRPADSLIVTPATPMRFGDTLVFTVAYHGKSNSGHGLTWLTSDGLPHRPDQIWSQGEDSDNRYWFPTYDFPNDKLTWELVATVPKHDLAISNGHLVSNVVAGNDRTMSWNQDTPSASYLVSLIVAPLALTHDSWHGKPVDYYTYHEDSTLAWPLFHVTVDMIDTYSRLTAVAYPWAKYAQTTVADFFGGMENVSATTLVDWLPDARAYRDRPWYQYILIPHELAHQWFGDYVTTENWANTWLNEGFAEFMPGQYWNAKLGAHAEQDYYVDEYRQFIPVDAQRPMPLASLGSNNIYPKGALVLKMLKDYLGPERFWAAIHTYLTTHAYAGATSDDLRQAVLAATGENLDWFWEEWVYAAGYPKFTVTSAYNNGARSLTLTIKQTQVDSFKVDSTNRLFNVPATFRMPINVRVAFAGGEVVRRVEINAREQTVTIDSITAPPTMVVFDAGNRMLKALTFEQPVSWLAAELANDNDLWDRQWAIGQLAQHPSDEAAASVLATAALHADYYLTRVQAIDALGGFPATVAMSTVAAAMRDTSAAVRTAAVSTLEKFGGDSVGTIARNAFHRDSSYEVRAAALRTAVHTDPAHAHELIGEGIAESSYQDAIANAAYQAMAQVNDTGYIAQLDAAMGKLEYPAHVLAVFGARGNAHALALVTSHLNDPRAGVRRYTVNAFRGTMAFVDKPNTIARLKAVLPTITHADTRQQVADLIATLEKP
jgi:aminopeptidase N